ncbi:MAG: arginase [Bacteroidia bacterium]
MNLVALLDLQSVNELKNQHWPEGSIGETIEAYTLDAMIKNDAPHFVIISILKNENDFFIYGIRENFYSLYSPSRSLRMADAGSFTGTEEELSQALLKIREYGSIPIIISANQYNSYHLYSSYCLEEQTINLCSVDVKPDLNLILDDENVNNYWLTKVIKHTPNYLFNYSLIGYQSYLSSPDMLKTIEQMNFDAHRLGQVRQNISSTEPVFRNSDVLSFDCCSIRGSDFSASSESEPNGLYAEEACRLMRYAGLSNKLSSVGIFGWSLTKRNDTVSSEKLVAQLIWHFADGIINRIPDGIIGNENDYTIYNLSSEKIQEEIIFYKNKWNARWWMKVPLRNTGQSKYERHQVVPCNYEDYQQAMQGELPETWWQTYQKLA